MKKQKNNPWLLFGDLLYFEIHVMSKKLQRFFFFLSTGQHEALKDLIHDLDIWHKSAKLVKALTDVSNDYKCLSSSSGLCKLFWYLSWERGCKLGYE